MALSDTEWRLIDVLLERLGCLVSPAALADAAWLGREPGPGALHVLIRRARVRVEPLGLLIHNVRGRGYVLDLAGRRTPEPTREA